MNEETQSLDWIYLPKDAEEISFWACLHDGELISCKSNLLECFVMLEFTVEHLLNDDEKNISFLLKLEDVTSVRAIGHFRWIGEFQYPENSSREEQAELLKEYWAKWREESVTWSKFEKALATDPLQVSNASYASNNDEITLKIGGFLNGEKYDDVYFDIFLRGKKLSASRSDGKDFSLDKFIELEVNIGNLLEIKVKWHNESKELKNGTHRFFLDRFMSAIRKSQAKLRLR